MPDIDDVRRFWSGNPLWVGESNFDPGSKEFFEEHRAVYIEDCFAGSFDPRFLPPASVSKENLRLLDLGCGIGFWTNEFASLGYTNITAADLTEEALSLTKLRLSQNGFDATFAHENAENLSFANGSFDHVNCQGVIHHTPNTQSTISEIARLLKPGGTASISVYYRNPILRLWPLFSVIGLVLNKLGGGLVGRGREEIFLEKNVDEIVRLYDGADNPIGKSYTKDQFREMLEEHFFVDEIYLHFFPSRALPFRIPGFIRRLLDRNLGFMIYGSLRKR